MDFTNLKDVLEFIVASATVFGFVVAIWKLFVKRVFKRLISDPVRDHLTKVNRMAETVDVINTEILPVIQSLSREFSKNSGKSIMDRILRIDDNTRLAELRTKLIASTLVTTGMLEFDKSGNLVWANKAFINMTGLDIESLSANSWIVSVEEDFRDKVWNLWKSSIQYNIPFESEFVIKHQITSNMRTVKCTIYPHKSVDGSILGYHGTVIDTE